MPSKPGADPDLLRHLSGAVADGEEVDWEAAERRLPGGTHGATLAALRLVSQVVRVRPGSRDSDRELLFRIPAWLWGLAGLVVAQLVLGATSLALAQVAAGGALQVATAWTFGLGALLLVQRPPLDRRGLALAGAFLAIASASTFPLVHSAAEAAGGLVLQVLALPLPECLLPLFLWRFARLFPHTRAASRLDRVAGWGTGVAAAAAALLALARLASLAGHEVLSRDGLVHWPVLFGLCVPALVVMWLRRRDAPPEERRRVVFFVAALAAGLAPLLGVVLADAASPAVGELLDKPGFTQAAAAVVYGCLLTIPLTTAHAAGSGRLVPVPALARAAAQRALGRAALGAALSVAGLLLAFRLWQSRHDSLAALAGDRLALVLVAFALGVALLLRWRRLLASRLGLRPRETWNERIAFIGRQVHSSRPDLLAEVVEQALGSFLGARVNLLVRRPDGTLADRGGQLPPLSPEHALALLSFQSRTPLEVGPESELFACLPVPDREWVRGGQVDRVVPIQGVSGALGLLALGSADLQLDREDLQGLEALAATLALALEAAAGPAAPVENISRECSGCGVVFEGEPPCTCHAPDLPATLPRLLNGKFQVERWLGRGGMGVVYMARDLELERAVALKTLPRLSGEAARRLRSEARAMASVRHPNVGQVYGLETWGGAPVVVLEYQPGGTLASRLADPLPAAAALDLAIDLAGGLAAVHDAGLLHRDVKPSNVGFDASGTPRLLDFGLSRLTPEAHAVVGPDLLLGWAGTPLYMSPAVLRGAEPGPADDVWSLLVVLHECLAGGHPLRGTPRDELLLVLRGGFPDVRSRQPACPPLLAETLHGWLAPEGPRPASARELRDELLTLREIA